MRPVKWLALAGVVGFLALLGYGLTQDPWELPTAMVGAPAPDLALAPLGGGEPVSLDAFRGEVVMVNFWASWCVPCIQEHAVIERAWREYGDRGVRVVGIPYRDTPAASRAFLERYGGGWTQLSDPDTRAGIDFGVYGVPETFFIGRDGRIAHKEVGPLTDPVMVEQLERLLSETGSEPGGAP